MPSQTGYVYDGAGRVTRQISYSFASDTWETDTTYGGNILGVKKNQPGLYAQVKNLPWRNIPAGCTQRGRGHGREEHRTLQVTAVAAGIAFPHAAQATRLTRGTRPLGGQKKWRTVTICAITSLDARQAAPAHLAEWIRGHWQIGVLHHIRDVSYGEDASQIRTGSGPRSWLPCATSASGS